MYSLCYPYVMSLKGIALKDAPKRQQAADAELVGAIHTFFSLQFSSPFTFMPNRLIHNGVNWVKGTFVLSPPFTFLSEVKQVVLPWKDMFFRVMQRLLWR